MSFSSATLARYGPAPGLLTHPLLLGLRRGELRRWSQAADEIELDAGDVLLTEDRRGDWFFLIEDGSARETRAGKTVNELGAGDNAGAVAILGLGPQQTTIAATTPLRAFVVGRRQFLALLDDMPLVQRRLFPDIGPGGLAQKLRELRAAASDQWKAVAKARADKRLPVTSRPHLYVMPGRRVESTGTGWAGVVRAFTAPTPTLAPDTPKPLPWRWRITIGFAAVVVAGLAGWAYHPPVLVVHPLAPVDVSRDIVVHGAPVHPVHGRYLLLTVKLERPNTFGALWAVATGKHRIPLRSGAGTTVVGLAPNSAEAFRHSQAEAAAAAAAAAGYATHPGGDGAIVVDALDHGGPDELRPGDVIVAVNGAPVHLTPDVARLAAASTGTTTVAVERDGERIDAHVRRTADEVRAGKVRLVLETRNPTYALPFTVTFRHRPIGGPSGGLIYALALTDMLEGRDLAGGRTIAATGEIDSTGDVMPVGFVADKTISLRHAHAAELLVPSTQAVDAAGGGRTVQGVFTLDDAIAALAAR
ncbi:MAG: cyclic nucleotide-binding domain-containing protein [Actinobacteria bacterium]|nr:cyclic nucleotide-binding domain-containing protein [Actinomycetota bacterium]